MICWRATVDSINTIFLAGESSVTCRRSGLLSQFSWSCRPMRMFPPPLPITALVHDHRSIGGLLALIFSGIINFECFSHTIIGCVHKSIGELLALNNLLGIFFSAQNLYMAIDRWAVGVEWSYFHVHWMFFYAHIQHLYATVDWSAVGDPAFKYNLSIFGH